MIPGLSSMMWPSPSMILVPSWLFISKYPPAESSSNSYSPSRCVHQAAKNPSHWMKIAGSINTRNICRLKASSSKNGAVPPLKEFLQAQADEADRLSSRVFARIEERKQNLDCPFFEKSERLGLVIAQGSALYAAGAIFGFEIREAHRQRDGTETGKLLFPKLGNKMLHHGIKSLCD